MARINPLVRIPSLVLNSGETLIDSAAILDTLDEMVGPGRALTPPSGVERRQVLQATAMAVGAMDKAGAWVYERHFHPPGQRNEKLLERYAAQLAGALFWLDAQTRDGHLCGRALSQADISAGALVFYLKLRVAPAFPRGSYPRLAALCDALEATDAFIATRPAPNESMPAA